MKKLFQTALIFCVLTPFSSALRGANVLTYHNDAARSGLNSNETILTVSNVNAATFALLLTLPVDGYVYAQPLVVTNVTIPSRGGQRDVVYVATEHDSVYAFDANNGGVPLWQVSFINPDTGITTVSSADVNCDDLVPEVGITSTPVIDPASGTIYVCARTKEMIGGVTNYYHRLHALDLGTGAEKFGGPVVVTATVTGNGDGHDGSGQVVFNPLTQFNRTSLLLSKGVVYIGSAAHCDNGPYHGWLLGYDAQTLALTSAFNTTPQGAMGGIWMSGCGPASDANGNIYAITGNGTFDPTPGVNCFGDSFLKLSTTNALKMADYFTPYNQAALSSADSDLGSGGAVLLPDEAGTTSNRHLLVGAGKEGTIYLINRDNMHHFNAANDSLIVQSLPSIIGSCFCTPAYFGNKLYWQGVGDPLKAFTISNAHITTNPVSQSATAFGFPGATPSISANGTNNAIVWTLQTDGYETGDPAILRAYDANNLSRELYNSSASGSRDTAGGAVKFTVPTVANGRVFVGGQSSLSVYGRATYVAAPTITPDSGIYAYITYVSISDGDPNATIYYTLDGSTPTTASTIYAGQFELTSSAHLQARAIKSGAFDSAITTADFTIIHPLTDTNSPTCTITKPVDGQRWSNNVFTVSGTAADDNSVATVLYRLNNNRWSSAATSDGWTNWTAAVNLTPGNNSVSTYAVDGSGNQSSTTTATVFYVQFSGLQVNINSAGGVVTPNYNNSLLQSGVSYAMTATAKPGFAFTNWTDGNGTFLTSKPKINFTMASGLVLSANFVDVSLPTVSITNLPVAGVVSNEFFTIKGKAADNVGSVGVYYNLNGLEWKAADTFNGWTNWSGNLDLLPGTNFIVISAHDAAGNFSISHTYRLVYVVSGTLTVKTNGNGGLIIPNYNNTLLQIGVNYAMTAIPKLGFAFTNWTDGTDTIVTNKPTLRFNMVSNLIFTANFADIAKPIVSVTNLPPYGMVSNNQFTIKGKASDNDQIANLFCNANNTDWSAANSTNNWTSWNYTVSLNPGTNNIAITAKDNSGNYSLSNYVRLVYIVSGVLTVNTNGKGLISPVGSGAVLQIGKDYTITASPATGFVFSHWSDVGSTVVTNRPAMKFVMSSNLTFTAHFTDVSKPVLTVTTPLATTTANAEFFNASGRASDNAGVASVLYQINGSDWLWDHSANGWTNWTVTLDLTPGTNYFSAYAVDTSGNLSLTNSVKFLYNTAPATLAGSVAQVAQDGSASPFYLAFGTGVFSQHSSDLNNANGAGVYAYTKLTPTAGLLKMSFTTPPKATNDSDISKRSFNLVFSAPGMAHYTCTNNASSGDLVFTSTPTLTPASVFNQTMLEVNDDGGGTSTRFTAAQFIKSDLATHQTNSPGSYVYAAYGPIGALIKQAGTNGVAYRLATFQGTNYGVTYSEEYDLAGNISGNRQGVFGLGSQRLNGNAPTNLVNRTALVKSVADSFKLAFDGVSFTQLNASNNLIVEGAGGYVYARAGANSGSLDLNFNLPPSTPSTSSALFLFAAPNFAIFTNLDSTLGAVIFK